MSEKYNDENIKKILEENEIPEEYLPENMKIMLDKFGHADRRKHKIKFNILKFGSAAAALALVIGVTAKIYTPDHKCQIDIASSDSLNISNMKYAKSYKEIYDYFDIKNIETYGYTYLDKGYIVEEADGEIVDAAPYKSDDLYTDSSSSETSGEISDEEENASINDQVNTYDFSSNLKVHDSQNDDYTNTYNQEAGVLEADIVKTDGKTIFYATCNEIRAAQVENGKFTNIETFANDIGYINEMYIYNDKLIVITDDLSKNYIESGIDDCYAPNKSRTVVTIYSKNDYSMIGQYKQDGYFTDVRLREDGFMYLITNDDYDDYYLYNDLEITSDNIKKYIPSYMVNDKETCLSCSNILISSVHPENYSPMISYINLSAFDINSPVPYNPTDVKAVAGNAGAVYCSMNNLYVTFGWDNTEITRFAIDSGTITPKAGTSVKGTINDQFSMSEYNGYFRIATTFDTIDFFGLNDVDTNNCLYVLDMSLNEVGSISGFGLDETIKSVNFNGNMAYIVTFRQTDPLYAIDLSDPENPKKTDELKITGYSSYMQSWSDGMLLGFGENGDEDGILDGLKLTMFDNSDPSNLKVIDSVEISKHEDALIKYAYSYAFSYALSDRKALLISPKNNIIGIPVNYNGTSSYKFYSFENGKFKELGDLSKEISNDYYYGFRRAVIINDYIYAFSDEIFMSADIKNIRQTDSYNFPVKDIYEY